MRKLKLENGSTVEISDESYKALEKGVQVGWKPSEDEKYWCVNSRGNVHNSYWLNDPIDQGRYELGNCFKVEKAADMHKLRLKSLAVEQTAKRGEDFWMCEFNGVVSSCRSINSWDYYIMCKKFAKKEEAQACSDEFSEAWKYINK